MDKKELFKLKEMGFTYLVKMKGINSFRPLRGTPDEAKQLAFSSAAYRDEVLSIEEAILHAEHGFEYEESISFDWMLTNLI